MRRWLLVFLLCGPVTACHGNDPSARRVDAPTQLRIVDLRVGRGAALRTGEVALVDYTGWLYDSMAPEHKGREFDSSRSRATPFQFRVGTGAVIPGWDRGLIGMRVGGRRELVVPAALAYGQRGAGGVIPPGAALLFDVDLVGIQ
ncbi:MAG: FKBP-type peptidyl-prolyl cis-trans isomerase [Gammaproteobacteria bacterium]|nr:FKBP-type peptidyl-prolyl cis-trans isomerase [Gammaproteobacteria bacterium]